MGIENGWMHRWMYLGLVMGFGIFFFFFIWEGDTIGSWENALTWPPEEPTTDHYLASCFRCIYGYVGRWLVYFLVFGQMCTFAILFMMTKYGFSIQTITLYTCILTEICKREIHLVFKRNAWTKFVYKSTKIHKMQSLNTAEQRESATRTPYNS